jgi:TonB family protein
MIFMKRSFARNAVVFVVAAAVLFSFHVLKAEQRGDALASAVDARGIRHRGSQYVGLLPWIADAVRKRKPDYPYKERTQHHEGSGLFRLTLDLTAGSVTKIDVVQSTGFAGLDESCIKTFRDWRWKPGRWKEVDFPVTFIFASPMPVGPTHGGGSMGAPDT